jgi:hypothetical protein
MLFQLPWRTKAGFLTAWRATRYDAPPTGLGGSNRWEDQFRVGVDLEKHLTDDLSLTTQFQYTKNSSNHALFEYKQRLLTLGVSYSF